MPEHINLVFDPNFAHHDAHHSENDERQAAMTFVGLFLGGLVVAAFVWLLVALTPHVAA